MSSAAAELDDRRVEADRARAVGDAHDRRAPCGRAGASADRARTRATRRSSACACAAPGRRRSARAGACRSTRRRDRDARFGSRAGRADRAGSRARRAPCRRARRGVARPRERSCRLRARTSSCPKYGGTRSRFACFAPINPRGRGDRRQGEGRAVPQPADIAHLLRRAGFGGTAAQIATLAAQAWATTVDQLLDFSGGARRRPSPRSSPTTSRRLGEGVPPRRPGGSIAWRRPPTPLQEKLTLFWHGHFATANYKVTDMRLMYLQNALFRSMATRQLPRSRAARCRCSPRCSSGSTTTSNTKGSPNENFARELMELFTLGVDQYTQDDVVASARAWTGHNTLDGDRTQYHFYPTRHDTGMKTFMGVTANVDRPRHHQLHPPRRPDAQEDRGPVHRHEDVGVLRVSRSRRQHRHVARERRSSPPTSRSRSSCARSSTTRRSSRPRRSKGSCARRPSGSSRACRRSASPPPTRTRSGGWPTWASSSSSRRTCRAGGRTATGSRPRASGRVRTGRATSSGRTTSATR